MKQTEDEGLSATYSQPVIDSNIINIRLNMSELLNDIQSTITGVVIEYYEDEDGELKRKSVRTSPPTMNEIGCVKVMRWLKNVFNTAVVQGNFHVDKTGKSEEYERWVINFQKNLGHYLMINMYYFELDIDEYEGLIDSIMTAVEPFMTRLKGNKERESYSSTMQHIENTKTTQESRGMGGIFS